MPPQQQNQPYQGPPPPINTQGAAAQPKSAVRRVGGYVGGRVAFGVTEKILEPYIKPVVDKLNAEIAKGNDYPAFLTMMLIAAFKDYLDVIWGYLLALIQAAVVIGQVASIILLIIKFLISVALTITIIYFMLGKGWLLRSRVKWMVYALWFFDLIPAVDLVPMESIGVFLAWRNVRQRAAKAHRKLKKLANVSRREAEELTRDITKLDSEPFL